MNTHVCESHDEDVVVYQASYPNNQCPLCAAVKKIDELQSEIGGLNTKVEDFAVEIVDLRDDVAGLKDEIREWTETVSEMEDGIAKENL